MSEYYHPESGKKVRIEEGYHGVITNIVETGADGKAQSLSVKSEDVPRFVEGLINAGWLPRQML